jgi:hypothetical protein
MSSLVNQTTGAIGYVELGYATRNKNAMGLVQNMEGDLARSRIMVEFMRWALTDSQRLAPALGYAHCPLASSSLN